jgi:hypothetical protein
MLNLTPGDCAFIETLVKECSREGEEIETTALLIDGFSTYGEEAVLYFKRKKYRKRYASKKDFFRDTFRSLLENIGFAGHTFEQAFSSDNGRDLLCQLVRSTGVHNSDVEDIVQEISRKLWQAKLVERYNPLISSWRNFLLVPIQRYVRTYNLRRSTKVTTGALPLDTETELDDSGRTAASCLYDPSQEEFLGDNLVRQEILEDWERFLKSQEPIRLSMRNISAKMCTLIPPGTSDIPTEEEMDVFFLQGGYYRSRVTTRELWSLGICPTIPNEQLVDYISEDPVTRVQYIDPVTGDFVTQKHFPNLHPDPSMVVKKHRTWMNFYKLIMRGLQIEEIARELKMASPSIPARIRKLELLFRNFWLISTKIPRESKILVVKTYRCPGCYQLDMTQQKECRVCKTDMSAEVAEVRFNGYPWPKVYVSRETYERLGTRRQDMLVQRGSISVMF